MPKDFKIGMYLGLAVVICVGLWLSTRPSLNARARISGPENAGDKQEIIEPPVLRLNSPDNHRTITNLESEEEKAKEAKTPRYHTVQNGDTLSGISYQYYGSENKWQKILDANRDVIQNVNNLRLGVRLIIPE
jgi:nucleoid-associated protein YgaU